MRIEFDTLSSKVPKDMAKKFRKKVSKKGTTPSKVLKGLIGEWLRESEKKRPEPRTLVKAHYRHSTMDTKARKKLKKAIELLEEIE